MLSRQHRNVAVVLYGGGDTRRWPRRILKSEDRADIRFCIGTLPLNVAILRLITVLIFALSGRKRYASNGGILDRASNRMRLATTNRPNWFTHEYQRTLTSTKILSLDRTVVGTVYIEIRSSRKARECALCVLNGMSNYFAPSDRRLTSK